MSRTTVKLSARDYNRAISPDNLNAQAQTSSNRNLIINGSMRVAQRATSATASANGTYTTIDRWKIWDGNDGAFTSEQSTDSPEGFSNSLKFACTTADISLAAGTYAAFAQIIEAQNLQSLDYGSSNAKTITLSFWVKSNKTGTYCIAIEKQDSTLYRFVKEYTISSANTWEYKTVTILPDSNIKAGAGAIANDNGQGLRVFWSLGHGSTYTGATDNTWHTGNQYATNNQSNWTDSTSNTFYLTGVQLEVGEKATEFEHEPYATTLAKCQRYYTRWQADSGYDGFAPGYWLVTTQFYGMYELPVQMRQEPTIAIGGSFTIHSNGADTTVGSLIVNRATPSNVQTYSDQASHTGTAGLAGAYRTNNDDDAYVEFKAEL